MMMKRVAFKMYLKPGQEKEYERRHAAIWPELVKMIHDAGVSNYSIFWDKDTNMLFGYQECEGEGTSQDTDHYPTLVGHDGRYHGGES
jgi:L-rhamnose mutarotase